MFSKGKHGFDIFGRTSRGIYYAPSWEFCNCHTSFAQRSFRQKETVRAHVTKYNDKPSILADDCSYPVRKPKLVNFLCSTQPLLWLNRARVTFWCWVHHTSASATCLWVCKEPARPRVCTAASLHGCESARARCLVDVGCASMLLKVWEWLWTFVVVMC